MCRALPARSLHVLNSNPFKNLGVTQLDSTLRAALLSPRQGWIFKHFGLDPDKDIKFLPLGTNERRFSAMKQGLTAGTMGSPPLDFLGKKMGFVVLARAYELFSYPTSGVVASLKRIKEKPDEVKRVIKAGIKATRNIHQNREGTIQFMTEWSKIDKEMAT